MNPQYLLVVKIRFKKTETSKRQLRGFLLSGSARDSKIFWVRLPIFLHNMRHRAKLLLIDPARVHGYLDVSPEAVKKLTESLIYPKKKKERQR